jgi:hypothetical protein
MITLATPKAFASRELFRAREIHASLAILRKDCFGATPKPARETHALPGNTFDSERLRELNAVRVAT